MTEAKPKRWFSYSLRMLFVLVTGVCILTAWYVNRFRIIKLEQGRLAGLWQVDIDPINPGPEVEFPIDKCDVGVPSNGIGQIDFHTNLSVTLPDGTKTNLSRAIYQWINDNQVQFAQAEPGDPRPTSFERLNPKTSIYSVRRAPRPNNE